jgi:hypothetical protein
MRVIARRTLEADSVGHTGGRMSPAFRIGRPPAESNAEVQPKF